MNVTKNYLFQLSIVRLRILLAWPLVIMQYLRPAINTVAVNF